MDFFQVAKSLEQQDCMVQELKSVFCTKGQNKAQEGVSCEANHSIHVC